MCGIVGAVADRDVPGILLAGLQRLEYRGYDSAGLAVIGEQDQQIQCRRRAGKVRELCGDLAKNPLHGRTGIAHTRWATHGVPSERNAHPHVSNGRVCLAHNGIIENFESLRDELMALGYEFTSQTDSEVIVHLVDHYLQDNGSLLQAVSSAVKRLEGAYALGSTKLEVSTLVVVPAALSGIMSAFILAVSRAIGETMIVTIAAGQNPSFTLNPFVPIETMTAYIVQVSQGDAPAGSIEFKTIFAVALLLFVITLVMNLLSQYVVSRFREEYE